MEQSHGADPEESWVFENNQSKVKPGDFMDNCTASGLISIPKFYYYDDIAKIKGLKTMKFAKDLKSILIRNHTILDYHKSELTKDLEKCASLPSAPIYVSMEPPKPLTPEHRVLIAHAIKHSCGKESSRDLLEFLSRRYEFDFPKLMQDLFFLSLTVDDFESQELTVQTFEMNIIHQRAYDARLFIDLFVSKQVHHCLSIVDFLYHKEDPTYLLITYLQHFLDRMTFILRHPNMSNFDLARNVRSSFRDIDMCKKYAQMWNEESLREVFIGLYQLEEKYASKFFPKSLGKTMLDQLIMKSLA